ncbi:MAG: hypothetical protein K9W44_04215 [Candidatus Lokiarchaeota archaeon]|nr:hypothetical protein [Candidatus Harpocratesius repetitus]
MTVSHKKPVIEINFSSYLPTPIQLDHFVEIIHNRFFEIPKKEQQEMNNTRKEISEKDLDEMDGEIEKMLKEIEQEEQQSRENLYI